MKKFLTILSFFIVVLTTTGQGYTFRDITFVASLTNGGASGGGTSGGGSGSSINATNVSDYFTMDESDGDNRISSIPGSSAYFSWFYLTAVPGLHTNAIQVQDSRYAYADPDLAYIAGDAVSFNYWFKLDAATGTMKTLPSFSTGPGLADSLYVDLDSDQLKVQLSEGGVGFDNIYDTTYVAQTTDWVMITVTYDGAGAIHLYRNGVDVASYISSYALRSGGPEFGLQGAYLGCPCDAESIDELVIFQKHVLTASEVTWLYNGGAGRVYTDF